MGSTDTSAAEKAAKSLQKGSASTSSSLSGSVGFAGENRPDDVRQVSNALIANGRLDKPTSTFGNEIGSKIITAQQDMSDNLKPDGLIKPGGPTENRFRQLADSGLMKSPAPPAPSQPHKGVRPASGDAALNAQASVRAKKQALADAKSKTLKSLNDPDRTPFQKAQNVRRIENAKREVQEAQERANRLTARKREREQSERMKQIKRDQKEMADKSQTAKKTIADALSSAIENVLFDQAPEVLPVSDEVVAANGRSAKYLASRSDMREFPRWEIEDIETQGAPAIAKTVDLIRQTQEVAPEQAERLYDRIVTAISLNNQRLLDWSLGLPKQEITDPRALSSSSSDDTLIGAGGDDQLGDFDPLIDIAKSVKVNWFGSPKEVKSNLAELSKKYREKGYALAADNLDHFLNGKGEDRVLTRDEARKDPFVAEAEKGNRRRFEQYTFLGNTETNTEVNEGLRELKDGESITLTDDWDRVRKGVVTYLGAAVGGVSKRDRALADGRRGFNSEATFTATRRGDKIHIAGTVDHNGTERYDFETGGLGHIMGAKGLSDANPKIAHEFQTVRRWGQAFEGTVGVSKGKEGVTLSNPKFNWRDTWIDVPPEK